MSIGSREDLKQYCLRALGAPVLEINVDDDQLEDRLDEALEYWRIYHHEGVEKMYLKQQINASSINLTTSVATQFVIGETVTGSTSGATALVTKEVDKSSSGTELLVRDIKGTFSPTETITGSNTNSTAVVSSVVLGEIDTRYVQTDDWVYGVSRVLPWAGVQSSTSMFDIQYQLRLNDMWDLTSTSVIYYQQVMSHLSLLEMMFNGKALFRFNRLQGRVYLDINWNDDIKPGEYVVLECYRALDPATFKKVWSEPWLKHYTTALFKRQWATNLKKFQGIQLHGGVTLDGQGMYVEALQEIKDLEDELINRSAPLEFFLG